MVNYENDYLLIPSIFYTISGPVTAMVNGKVTLVGVVSFGGQNCPNNLPVGFSRVSFQRDWILSNSDAGDWQCNGTSGGIESLIFSDEILAIAKCYLK